MRDIRLILLLLLCTLSAAAQSKHALLFYNVENLFDTEDDPTTNDDEFTPKGSHNWTQARYQTKLTNIERVLFDISSIERNLPTVIALAEVENRKVVEDIVAQPKLSGAKYKVVHYDSPDTRGVDVALVYRPDLFELDDSKAHRSVVPTRPDYRARDILTAWGTIEGQEIFLLVAHWPSRHIGQKASEYLRVANASQMRAIIDSVTLLRPDTRFIAMGDFNDNPHDVSVTEHLKAKGNIKKLEQGELFNPYSDLYKGGYGTLAYSDKWNIFDQIVVSQNLIDGKKGTLQLQESLHGKKYYGQIFNAPYLYQTQGRYKGYPLRTYSAGTYTGGYSDHFPIYIYISCELRFEN